MIWVLVGILFLLWMIFGTWLNDQYPSSGVGGGATAAALDRLTKLTTLTLASTSYVCDSLFVQAYDAGEWKIELTKGTAKRSVTVRIWHDGSLSSGATTALWTVDGGAAQGTVDVTISATLTGSGATQAFNLVVNAASTGWTAGSFRLPMVKIPQ
jgi:hypothetical protein